MSVFSCCSSRFARFSRAAARAAGARLRAWGVGTTAADWAQRAQLCEQCPLRVVKNGVSYCGQPFLEQPTRDAATEGCGCPTLAKAKSPDEHCPLDTANRPARSVEEACACKWCALRRPSVGTARAA